MHSETYLIWLELYQKKIFTPDYLQYRGFLKKKQDLVPKYVFGKRKFSESCSQIQIWHQKTSKLSKIIFFSSISVWKPKMWICWFVAVYQMLVLSLWGPPAIWWCRIPPLAGPASPVPLQVAQLLAVGILSRRLPWQQQQHWRVQKTDWDQSDPRGLLASPVSSLAQICS